MSSKLLQYQQTFSPIEDRHGITIIVVVLIIIIIIQCHQQDNHHNQCNRCQSFIQPSTSFYILMTVPGGGRGVLNNCLYGEAPPRGPTPHPFIYNTSRHIPSIDKWYPFHNLFSTKSICQPFWALSQTQMTDFPTLLYTSTSEIPTLSHTRSLNKIPLSTGGHFVCACVNMGC